MLSSQFRVGRSWVPTDRRPSVQKGGVGNWGRLFSIGVVRTAVGAQSERGGVLILFDLSWPKDVALLEGDGTSKYTAMLWSEITSQVAHSHSRPSQNETTITPYEGNFRPRLRTILAIFSSQREPGWTP